MFNQLINQSTDLRRKLTEAGRVHVMIAGVTSTMSHDPDPTITIAASVKP